MKAYLTLQNGRVFAGEAIGAIKEAVGEIVFTTAMTGYVEALTNPEYYGQLVMQTFPLIGNCGVASEDMESAKCRVGGYIVRELCDEPSNFRAETTLNEFLKKQGVCGICGIDTRELTRIIRDNGVMNAKISYKAEKKKDPALDTYKVNGAVKKVTCLTPGLIRATEKKYTAALIDLGVKNNLISALNALGFDVIRCPAETPADEILKLSPDAVVVSSGPGDPKDNIQVVDGLKKLLGILPVFGVGLGHQVLALAFGADTCKLKYGHRGANHPVKDADCGKVLVTVQNHGFAVDGFSLPSFAKVTHINMNDGTCEGAEYCGKLAYGIQFSPADSEYGYLFDKLIGFIKAGKNGGVTVNAN